MQLGVVLCVSVAEPRSDCLAAGPGPSACRSGGGSNARAHLDRRLSKTPGLSRGNQRRLKRLGFGVLSPRLLREFTGTTT